MVGTPLLSPVSAHYCLAQPLSPPTTVLCHQCPTTVPSDCHLIPPSSHPSSCPRSPISPQSHTAITSSHHCHPHPTLPPLSVTVPLYTAMPSHHPPHTILTCHCPLPPLSQPTTILSCHHCVPSLSQPTTISFYHHLITPPWSLSVTSPPTPLIHSGPCSLPSSSQCPARGGTRDPTLRPPMSPSAWDPHPVPPGSATWDPATPVSSTSHPNTTIHLPVFWGWELHAPCPPVLSYVLTFIPTGQGGLVLPPEPAVPPSCHRSRGGPVPPPSSPFKF